jgi:uncharacterized protein
LLVAVISDTHVPDFARALPDTLAAHLDGADVILHAGDATSPATLAELELYAPVHAALGNIDRPDVADWGARPEVRLDLEGLRIGMVHDAGPRKGRAARLRRRFPDAGLIVFGHSHIPVCERDGEVWLLNPGSPTWKRREPRPTMALVEITGGVASPRVVEL